MVSVIARDIDDFINSNNSTRKKYVIIMKTIQMI